MSEKKILWVDERTSDYVNRKWDFREAIESRSLELVVCGEGRSVGMQQRAVTCNKAFYGKLCQAVSDEDVDNILGFIIDVNMPIDDLAIYSERLQSISTSGGAYTGFKVAQFVLNNHRRNLSPFGNCYRDKPILFLSISGYHLDGNTSWMGGEYTDYDQTASFTKYTHLQKSVIRKSMRDAIKQWADFVNTFSTDSVLVQE